MLFEDIQESVHHMLPTAGTVKVKLLEIRKSALSESLKLLINDLAEILNGIDAPTQGVRLRQVSIAVQFTTEGGIAWIASAKTGLSNSMTLTFDVGLG